MTARLNRVVKMTSTMVDFFFSAHNRFEIFSKSRMIRTWAIFASKFSFFHIYKFLAYCFFVVKKWKNTFENIVGILTSQSPDHLVSSDSISGAIEKIKIPSKSLSSPSKKWNFRIVALNLRYIAISIGSGLFIFLNVQRTFCIYPSCKIREIRNDWSNANIGFIQFIFHVLFDKIFFKLKEMHFFIESRFISAKKYLPEFKKKIAFFSLFYEKRSHFIEDIKKFCFKSKMIGMFSSFVSWISIRNSSLKIIFKPINIFFVDRDHRKIVGIFGGYAETAVPINITSGIGKFCIFHMLLFYSFSLFGSTSNSMLKFTTGIIGEDRFGTVPIRSSYLMLASTELEPEFDGLTGSGFQNSWAYPNGNNAASPAEYGNVFNIRILTSSQAPVARRASVNGRDVFYNIISGKQGCTHISQDGASMNLIYRDALFSGMLAQNVTLAVKFWQSQALTQPTAILKLACTKAA